MKGRGHAALLAGTGMAALMLGGQVKAQQVEQLQPLIITVAPLQSTQEELVEGSTVLTGDRLERYRGLTIGETLDRTPGVANSSFGAGAGRPVIRGQGGNRVRVLQNGLDTFDASVTSPDHAVVAPMGSATQVEVLRGPASLLYGSSAVAGVVNVKDGRIPDSVPKDFLDGTARMDFSTGSSNLAGFGSVDMAAGKNVVLHLEGFTTDANDYRINGFSSDEAREEGIKGRVENSFVDTRGGAIGASYLGERGYAGMAISGYSSLYGIPGGHSHAEEHEDDHEEEEDHDHEHEHGEESIRIDMQQTRYDLKFGLYDPLPFLDEASARFGYADYRHIELEGDEIGTIFENQSWEGRIELTHKPLAGFKGVFGLQSSRRDAIATGEEAFIPGTLTDNNALFLVERFETGPWLFTLGGRVEHQTVEAGSLGQERSFTGKSASAGATYRLNPTYSVGLSLSRTERAPNAEELFSDGAHLATQSYEVGNSGLGKEAAWHAELSFRKQRGDVTGAVNLFATRYHDYIFRDFTGNERDGLQEVRYGQEDATFRGAEIEATWVFLRSTGLTLSLDGAVDYVWAENEATGQALPLIPPLGYTAGINAYTRHVDYRLELEGAASQSRTGANEDSTGGYAFLNAGLSFRPIADSDSFTLFVQGRNLTDAEGRNHVSLLKDVAPFRGRELRVGGQVKF
ncbi:MAG: TonB-dependent receptor [Alphaproteobacteria bacterium]|nr:TonB-dependent receptor [Alphaproteobacteria bacterium]MBU0795958.1 TonB-dependent receptor [Alphaproteobacteria bacterium]MBU0886487.1 TonB-dependent receptor [Alphaproteobacteria bacterium]MBU1812290.1 TonB-dependent receptor [Alphaproteobacteria bacterium]